MLSVEKAKPESTKQELKTLHFEDIDVVLPTSNMSESTYRDILAFIAAQRGSYEDRNREKTGDHPAKNRHFLIDKDTDKPCFVKERRTSGPENITAKVFAEVRGAKKRVGDLGDYDEKSRRRLNASHSVINEFAVVRTVSECLATTEAKEIARAQGFTQIEVIKPLFGAIDKRDMRKYTAYPYMKGAKTISQMGAEIAQDDRTKARLDPKFNDLETRLELATWAIGHVLTKYGITIDDYGPNQVLYDEKTNILYLNDTESWHVQSS